MVSCKRCGSEKATKTGIVYGKQRFLCKNCGYNFRLGDYRISEKTVAKKTLCILWYSTGSCSFRTLSKFLQTDHSMICRWIQKFGKKLSESIDVYDIKQLEFDELWRLVDLKKEYFEALKQLIAKHEKQLPKTLVNAILEKLVF